MRIQNFFRQLILEYNSDNDTPTPDSAPPCDAPADQLRGGHIVSKWRRLEQFDPKSQEYLLLLTSILDDRADRKATTSLEGEDAAVVLDILARVLARGRNLGKLSSRTLGMLRGLAFNACQVPDRYKIDCSLVFEIDPVVFASGGFSDVRRGNLGGQLVAVKVLRTSLNSNLHELQKHFCKEAVLWKNISHPNILGLIAVEIDSYTGKCSMISELMVNGNIVNFIRLNSVNRLRLLADAAEGLQYLHDRKLIHGDVKGPNILITNGTPPRACLSDFGFSTPAPTVSYLTSTEGMNPGGGTRPYMAPELIYPAKFNLPQSKVSREGDIYAFGMVIYEIVTGVRPFGIEGFRPEEVVFVVLDGKRPAKPEDVEAVGFGRAIWDLVEKCWLEDRMQRPKTWDVRLSLSIAASMSSPVPPGPRMAVSLTRGNSSSSMVSSTHIELFGDDRGPTTPTDPDGSGETSSSRQDTGSIFEHPMIEHSLHVASQVVNTVQASIPPAIREKFAGLEHLQVRDFIDNFRARFNFDPPRTNLQQE